MKQRAWFITAGVVSILLMLGGILHAHFFNGDRLITPIDSSYVFQPGDLPIIIGIAAFCLYVLLCAALLVRSVWRQRMDPTATVRTRKLNHYLGLLGFLGFLGFFGIYTYSVDKSIFPFCFFCFFGFFGFFFEGKMSNTYMDERFQENAQRAQLRALKIGFTLVILTLFLVGQGRWFRNLEHTAIIYTVVISLSFALTIFLSQFFLYRYDHDELDTE